MNEPFCCKPYELSREEFNYFYELKRPDGNGQTGYRKGVGNKLEAHLKILDWLSFGVHKWLFDKAKTGDQEALFKLEYNYDLYTEVLNKAREEKLI